MKYIISYDIGTSGIKCGLFDEQLHCVGITRCDYTVRMSPNGTVEAEPMDYIHGLIQCTQEAIKTEGVRPGNIVSMSITTQGETLIPVDQSGTPLCPAIVWLDCRGVKEAEELRKAIPNAMFRMKTGLPALDGYTPLAKLLHIKRNMPLVFEKTDRFLLLEDFVGFWLTGRTVSQKSLLSSTGYFDLEKDDYWYEALSVAGIDEHLLPEAVEPGDYIADLRPEAAEALGLSANVKLYAGAMDQVAGAIGCGNFKFGTIHETTGTAMIVATTLPLADAMRQNPQLTVYRHAEKGKYLLLSIGRTATTILKWFSEQFYGHESRTDIYEHLSQIAEHGTPGSNGITLLPYFEGTIGDGEDIKGTFANVGLHNTREDFVRAVFEGVAYMLQDNLELMQVSGVKELISIGGASKSKIWNQIKADVTGCQIVTMPEEEAALLGCAYIAAVGSGLYPSLGDAPRETENTVRYTPEHENVAFYRTAYQKYTRLKKAMEQLSSEI